MSRTIIVVPCYNEAERLDVRAFREFAAATPGTCFLFVNDGSTDGTAELLDELCLAVPLCFGVLHLEANRGKAEAVRTGVLAAFAQRCDYVGYWDADLATPLRAIPTFRIVLDERPDIAVVLGARVRLLGRQIKRRAVRHYLGRVFATAASAVLGVPVYDTQCGAKLFRSSPELRQVFQVPFGSRWIFDVEILARLLGLRQSAGFPDLRRAVYELPLIEWQDVGGSKVRPRDFARAALDLFFLYRRYLRAPQQARVSPAPAAQGPDAEEVQTMPVPQRHIRSAPHPEGYAVGVARY